jgi:hypothetical protein
MSESGTSSSLSSEFTASRRFSRRHRHRATIIDIERKEPPMPARFAYSLNGENYSGTFSSRECALAAGLQAAQDPMNMAPPQTIYVARRAEADPHAAGHAKTILREMAWQAHDEVGASATNYLNHLREEQIRDLDLALEQVLYDWLRKHELLPNYFKVEGISEHPVPSAPSLGMKSNELREVNQVGQARDGGI